MEGAEALVEESQEGYGLNVPATAANIRAAVDGATGEAEMVGEATRPTVTTPAAEAAASRCSAAAAEAASAADWAATATAEAARAAVSADTPAAAAAAAAAITSAASAAASLASTTPGGVAAAVSGAAAGWSKGMAVAFKGEWWCPNPRGRLRFRPPIVLPSAGGPGVGAVAVCDVAGWDAGAGVPSTICCAAAVMPGP